MCTRPPTDGRFAPSKSQDVLYGQGSTGPTLFSSQLRFLWCLIITDICIALLLGIEDAISSGFADNHHHSYNRLVTPARFKQKTFQKLSAPLRLDWGIYHILSLLVSSGLGLPFLLLELPLRFQILWLRSSVFYIDSRVSHYYIL